MKKGCIYETPNFSLSHLHSIFPILNDILNYYSDFIDYWNVYSMNNTNTTVFLIRSDIDTIVLLANRTQCIFEEEIIFVKNHFFKSYKGKRIFVDRLMEIKLERKYNKEYKEFVLLKQVTKLNYDASININK